MAKQKEKCPEYETSSGNVFADLGLEQSDELLASTQPQYLDCLKAPAVELA